MEIQAIHWLGIRSDRHEELVAFFENVLGLRRAFQEGAMTGFLTINGDTVEVFSPEDEEHPFFTTGPVAGFLVDDVRAARDELDAAGVELLGDVRSDAGWVWQHFRAPDGNVYEITGRTPERRS
jgi:catechol 2,3-dioxygenase-like lactoylglutathione lyase family enzyme